MDTASLQAILDSAVALKKQGTYKGAITADSADQAGWIEFGRPQPYPGAMAEPPLRAFQPHEGMNVLFPSYFYHRTIPFESNENRVSIAFDIVPAA